MRYPGGACEFQNKRRPNGEQVSGAHHHRPAGFGLPSPARKPPGSNHFSSQSLAEQFHLNAAQIRKDLAYFGEFGVRGVGYYVKDLKRHLRQILGLDRKLRVAVMGAGNLGLALADYPGFRREGFEITALFDVADAKIGDESRSGVPIYDIRESWAAQERSISPDRGARRVRAVGVSIRWWRPA